MSEPASASFPQRLKRLREKAGFTQEEMADALKIGRPYYNQIEGGKREPGDRLENQVNMVEVNGIHLLNTPGRTVAGYPEPAAPSSMLNEDAGHAPTKAQCLAHFSAYLDKAARIAGGVGHTWVQLQLHFSISDLDKLRAKTGDDKK